jgi:hypothetical protein
MSDNTSILIFKAITSFIADLDSEFGKKHKSIALYNRLLEKTGIVHIGPIHKHIECFKKFFDLNKNAMNEQNSALFENSKIIYSEKVYVDIATVLRQTSQDNKKIIWQHLFTIWGLIDPSSEARRLLNEAKKNGTATNEDDFLSNIIEKVETVVSSDKIDKNNPLTAITSLMQSGIMSDLVTGMQKGLSEGSLDVGKLMNSVQTMMGKMGGTGTEQGQNGGGMSGMAMPDLGQMMSMMGPMLGNMGNMGMNLPAPQDEKKEE